jgi:putative membrane protein
MNKLNLVAALTLGLAIPTAALADDKPAAEKAAEKADKAAGKADKAADKADKAADKADKAAAHADKAADKAAAGVGDGPDPAELLNKLHHANQMEIEAGKLAQEKGASKAVKAYGKTLVRDHSAADKKVIATAKQLKVELPKEMPPMSDAKMDEAKAAAGEEFDKKFAAAMLDDHKKDVEETSEARDKTTNPKLKKLLAGLVPTLEKHRDTAQKIVDGDTAAKK